MRIQWLLVVLLVIFVISGECRRRRGQRRNARRNKVRQRMKTTTEPPKPEPETEAPEPEPEKWEKEDGGDLDEVNFDLAIRFFNGFDDDNIYEEPDPNLLVNEPEVVDFKAPFPHNEKELLEINAKGDSKMIYEKPDNNEPKFNETMAREIGGEVQENFISNNRNKLHFIMISTTEYNLKLGSSYSLSVKLDSGSEVNMGDMKVMYFMGDQRSKEFYLNNLKHGWEKKCLQELSESNVQGEYLFEGTTVCTRSYGFRKQRLRIDQSTEAKFSSIVCIETLTSRSSFGKIVCVSTPLTPSSDKRHPDKILCEFDTYRYYNEKQEIDTIVDVNDEERSLSKCPDQYRRDIKKMLFTE